MIDEAAKSVKQLAADLGKSITAIRYQIRRQNIEIKDGLVYGDGIEKLEKFYKEKDADKPERKAYEPKEKKPKTKSEISRKSKLPYETPETEGMLIGKVYPSQGLKSLLARYETKFAEYDRRIGELESAENQTFTGGTFGIVGTVELQKTPEKQKIKHKKRGRPTTKK